VTADTRLVNAGIPPARTVVEVDVDVDVEADVDAGAPVEDAVGMTVVLDPATGADRGVADDAQAPHHTDRARSATHRGSRRRTHS
jgi:hypothetical protein